MEKLLPFKVEAFGALVAAFNNLSDAQEFAVKQSLDYTNGWWNVMDVNNAIVCAYSIGHLVYGEE